MKLLLLIFLITLVSANHFDIPDLNTAIERIENSTLPGKYRFLDYLPATLLNDLFDCMKSVDHQPFSELVYHNLTDYCFPKVWDFTNFNRETMYIVKNEIDPYLRTIIITE